MITSVVAAIPSTESPPDVDRRWVFLPSGRSGLRNGDWRMPFRAAVLQALVREKSYLSVYDLRLRVWVLTDGRVVEGKARYLDALEEMALWGLIESNGGNGWRATPAGRAEQALGYRPLPEREQTQEAA